MADLTLATADKVNVGTLTVVQHTTVAAEDIGAGAPVLFDGNGKWINADANGSGTVGCYGVSTKTVLAGEALTAIRIGLMDGWSNLPAYGAPVYVSNTTSVLSDSAGSTTLTVGFVVPIDATLLGVAYDKAIFVHCTASPKSA